MLKKVSPKSLYQLYSSICLGKILYEHVSNNPHLSSYLHNKISGFDTLLNDMDSIIHFFNEVFILDEIKEIDNIQKIEKSFIKDGVDSNLDNKIKTLMDSQDQLEACRSYFSSVISTYESVSYTHLPSPRDVEESRMPSSA